MKKLLTLFVAVIMTGCFSSILTYAEQLQPNEENIQDNIEQFAVETIWTMNETRYLAPWSTSKTGPFYLRAKIEGISVTQITGDKFSWSLRNDATGEVAPKSGNTAWVQREGNYTIHYTNGIGYNNTIELDISLHRKK